MIGIKRAGVGTAMVLTIFLAGCPRAGETGIGHPLSAEAARDYFADVEIGYPISKIETDLGLPDPYETQAPVRGWRPYWLFRYSVDELAISFLASHKGGEHPGSYFVYAGEPRVWTRAEYREAIRQKFKSMRPDTPDEEPQENTPEAPPAPQPHEGR